MGILNVDNIQPVGGGTTITLNSSEINVGAGITFESNGQAIYAGVTTFASNINLGGDIIHSGDNTKIRFPANDTITFETSGSEKLRITSNGKVGIGTINPQQLLEVQDRSGGTLIGLSVGTQYGNAGFGGYNNYPAIMNNVANPLIYCDTNNDRTIFFGDTVGFGTTCAFRVNGAERLRIGSSGQIGVAGANYGTAGQVLTSQGSGSAVQWATPASATSGTYTSVGTGYYKDITTTSTNVIRYDIMFTGVSIGGGMEWQFQLGDSGGVESSGYKTVSAYRSHNTSNKTNNPSNAFRWYGVGDANFIMDGRFSLTRIHNNKWFGEGLLVRTEGGSTIYDMIGTKELSGALTTIRISSSYDDSEVFDGGHYKVIEHTGTV